MAYTLVSVFVLTVILPVVELNRKSTAITTPEVGVAQPVKAIFRGHALPVSMPLMEGCTVDVRYACVVGQASPPAVCMPHNVAAIAVGNVSVMCSPPHW